jgi:hypothetical protein
MPTTIAILMKMASGDIVRLGVSPEKFIRKAETAMLPCSRWFSIAIQQKQIAFPLCLLASVILAFCVSPPSSGQNF